MTATDSDHRPVRPPRAGRALGTGLVLWLLGTVGFILLPVVLGSRSAFENPVVLLGTFLLGTVGFVMTVVQLWRMRRASRRR